MPRCQIEPLSAFDISRQANITISLVHYQHASSQSTVKTMLQQVHIRGLARLPTKEELVDSRLEFVTQSQTVRLYPSDLVCSYNSLPTDDKQPRIPREVLQAAADLFVSYRVAHKYGLHLLHRHEELPEGTVLVGESHSRLRGRWAKPSPTGIVLGREIHGHVFRYVDHVFRPYEYHDGAPADFTPDDEPFFSAFATFLQERGLENVLGFEVIEQPYEAEMTEIVISQQGTVMLETSILKGCKPYRQTGWKFEAESGKPRVCKDGTQHHGTGPKGHITVEGSLGRIANSFDDVVDILRLAGILPNPGDMVSLKA